jgi:ABC-2 type transport system ATP-binding protein
MTKVIEVSGLRKSYGRTVALDALNLEVAAGEVHGFLGPNGAGKTTTIRILLGLLRAGGGTARLLGGDPWREAVALHRRLAYVPGDVTLWPGLTGGEVIDLLGRLRGGLDPARRAALIERFALDPAKKARTYSTGNRQKVALIAALATDAELLILDEPTAGLDPLMEAVFRDSVQDERQRGRTVLLSSHILSEVEALCDRVTIIRAGATVETGTLAQLRHLTRTSITAELAARPNLDQLPGLHGVTIEPGPGPGPVTRLHCEVDAARLDELLARLVAAGVRSLVSRPPTLEELFLRHYAASPDTPDTAGPDTPDAPGSDAGGPDTPGSGEAGSDSGAPDSGGPDRGGPDAPGPDAAHRATGPDVPSRAAGPETASPGAFGRGAGGGPGMAGSQP